jgi:ribosomal protein S18 acetylase RimI-like enzyme
MLEPGEMLSDGDLERIARLHRVSLDDSLPSFLGDRYLARFYRYLASSALEQLLVARSGDTGTGSVDSVCVLSFDPGSMQRRAVQATLVPFAVSASTALVRDSAFRDLVLRMLTARSGVEGEPPGSPEITHIFTDPAQRGRALGRALVERVDRHLRDRGVPVCYVRTIDDPENRALAFYDRNGYQRVGRTFGAGRGFVVFKKTYR